MIVIGQDGRILTVLCFVQDGRAEVVANDAGDRVTPAVVAYRDTEQVLHNDLT
jgi:molecular chaperone DnaK (HSP70)